MGRRRAAEWLAGFSLLVFVGLGCKRPAQVPKPPDVPSAPVGRATGPGADSPVGKAADRGAAQAANRQGMRAYRSKDYVAAKQQFGIALKADASFALPHYNLACVAALTGDAAMAREQLSWLAQSPEPQARRTLRKALYDADLKSLTGDPGLRSLLHWGGVIGGIQVLVDSRDATEEESKRLRQSNDTYDEECDNEPTYRATFALAADVASDRPGSELVTASLASGVALFDARGKLIARGGGYECVGSSAGLFGIALAQIVPDPEPEILVHYESGGRESHAQALDILKRKGDTLATVLSFTLSQSERTHGDDDADGDERTSSGTLSLASDGSLLSQAAGERQPSILRWNVAKFAFIPADTVDAAAHSGSRSPDRQPAPAK